MSYLLAIGLIAALGVIALQGSVILMLVGRPSKSEVEARELAAQRKGELLLAAMKVEQANKSVVQLEGARKFQEERADGLESEIADAPKPVPGDTTPGFTRLSGQASKVP